MRFPSMLAVAGIILWLCPQAVPQQPSPFPQPTYNGNRLPYGDRDDPFANQNPTISKKRFAMLNAERQKEMVSDTEKLLRLVQQFHAGVQQEGDGHPSSEQMRRLAEIGKLARNVREKMSYSLGGTSPPPDPIGVTP